MLRNKSRGLAEDYTDEEIQGLIRDHRIVLELKALQTAVTK
jgi:hypothetical protein